MYLGYAVPVVGDEQARAAAVRTLLSATASPAYRVYALRGLAPATHDLPAALEGETQAVLLDLLVLPLGEVEKITTLVALDAFTRSRQDLPRRRPDLVTALETAVLVPIEVDPAAFAAKGYPSARGLEIAIVWHSARNRAAIGEFAALARVNMLLASLATLEGDAGVKRQIDAFLAAPPPDLL